MVIVVSISFKSFAIEYIGKIGLRSSLLFDLVMQYHIYYNIVRRRDDGHFRRMTINLLYMFYVYSSGSLGESSEVF